MHLKNKFLIIGMAIAVALTTTMPVAYLQDAQSPVVQACESQVFTPPEIPNETLSPPEVRQIFAQANRAYHSYIQCIFDGAVESIIGSTGADTEGFLSANAPNLLVPNFMKPETACLSSDALNKVITGSEPQAILTPILGTYTEYSRFLNSLADAYRQNPEIGEKISFSAGANQAAQIENEFGDELEDALIGIDNAFIALKEMRLAFVMHVQLQCLLGNLEKYRDMLAETRTKMLKLPRLILDASCT